MGSDNRGRTIPNRPDDWESLAVRMQGGDESAAEALAESLFPPLANFARRSLGDPASADDVAQETWVAAWQTDAPIGNVRAWLGGVVRNLAGMRLRAERTRREREAAKAELDEFMAGWDWGSVRGDATFVEGDVLACLQEHAANAGLVVMGTHGRTRLSRYLVGSVAHGMVKSSKGAIVVVPAAGAEWELAETV